MENVHRVTSTVHDNRSMSRHAIVKFQATRGNEKTLKASGSRERDIRRSQNGIRLFLKSNT